MRLAIFGAGGHGKVVYEAALTAGYTDIVFYDVAWPKRSVHMGAAIVGDEDALYTRTPSFDLAFVAVGKNSIRKSILKKLRQYDIPLATLVHSRAIVSPTVRLGAGTVVLAGAVVNADTHIGDGCILNISCTVDHDCIIDDCVHIGPGANIGSEVKIGLDCFIGLGAVVGQRVSLINGSNIEERVVLSQSHFSDNLKLGHPPSW